MNTKISILSTTIIFISGLAFAQPKLVKDVNPGSNSAIQNANTFGFLNGEVFFAADDGVNGLELWKSDGNGQNTQLVKNIRDGGASSSPNFYHKLDDKLIFYANDGVHGNELWITDGTEEGTQLLKDIYPGSNSSLYNARNFAELNGKLYFTADDGVNGKELWSTDGTEGGTNLVIDLNYNPQSATPEYIIAFNGKLFFTGRLGNSPGSNVIVSDGTEAGTNVLFQTNPGSNGTPINLIAANDGFYFTARHPTYGLELWKSDGTPAGTKFVKDIWPNDNGINYSWFANSSRTNYLTVGNKLYFVGRQTTGLEHALWVSDGTEEGTIQLTDPTNPAHPKQFEAMAEFNGGIIFNGRSAQEGYEPFFSDGTPEGTRLIKNLNTGSTSSLKGSTRFYSWLGRTVFIATHPDGENIYITDGTEQGTNIFYSGLGTNVGANHAQLMVLDSSIYYFAFLGTTGFELWNYKYQPFSASLGIKEEIKCNGDKNGRLGISPVGGYSPFSVQWENPDITSA
ncbi:MAG: hypothetical protein R2784_19880, partial [Saprospiraceae bacterium]